VREVVEAVGRALGKPVPHSIGARRAGDPPSLVADPAKARTLLGWSARRSGLEQIVEDALRWEKAPAYGSGLRGSDHQASRTPAE
jgi:UDP-glucose 4-epimerase